MEEMSSVRAGAGARAEASVAKDFLLTLQSAERRQTHCVSLEESTSAKMGSPETLRQVCQVQLASCQVETGYRGAT